jgi:hypothetical protein
MLKLLFKIYLAVFTIFDALGLIAIFIMGVALNVPGLAFTGILIVGLGFFGWVLLGAISDVVDKEF